MPQKQVKVLNEHQRRQALAIDIREGALANATTALGTTYIAPLVLAMKATTTQIGLLNSLSSLAAPLAQLSGTHLLEHFPRKKIVSAFILVQAILWIPLSLLALLFWKTAGGSLLVYILITLYTASAAAGGFLYPSWFSWMGDLVKDKERGAYFSKRNLTAGIVEIGAIIVSIFILHLFEPRGLVVLAYALFFLLAFICRFTGYRLIKKQYDPPFVLKKKAYFSLWTFIKRYDNFGKFAVYQFCFHIALMIASPFFIVYMARDLGFSPTMYVTITLVGAVFHLIFLPFVGKISDRYGNRKLLILSNLCFVLSPLAWIVIHHPIGILLVPQLISGLANAAFAIGFTNFTYDSVSPQHRPLCISYTSIFIGAGTFIGSLAGGLLLDYLPHVTEGSNPFFIVFGLAAGLRLLVALIFLPKIKEKKHLEPLPRVYFHIAHPFKTAHAEATWISHLVMPLSPSPPEQRGIRP